PEYCQADGTKRNVAKEQQTNCPRCPGYRQPSRHKKDPALITAHVANRRAIAQSADRHPEADDGFCAKAGGPYGTPGRGPGRGKVCSLSGNGRQASPAGFPEKRKATHQAVAAEAGAPQLQGPGIIPENPTAYGFQASFRGKSIYRRSVTERVFS